MRTAILLVVSLLVAACAPAAVAGPATADPVPARSAVAIVAAVQGEITLDIVELI